MIHHWRQTATLSLNNKFNKEQRIEKNECQLPITSSQMHFPLRDTCWLSHAGSFSDAKYSSPTQHTDPSPFKTLWRFPHFSLTKAFRSAILLSMHGSFWKISGTLKVYFSTSDPIYSLWFHFPFLSIHFYNCYLTFLFLTMTILIVNFYKHFHQYSTPSFISRVSSFVLTFLIVLCL